MHACCMHMSVARSRAFMIHAPGTSTRTPMCASHRGACADPFACVLTRAPAKCTGSSLLHGCWRALLSPGWGCLGRLGRSGLAGTWTHAVHVSVQHAGCTPPPAAAPAASATDVSTGAVRWKQRSRQPQSRGSSRHTEEHHQHTRSGACHSSSTTLAGGPCWIGRPSRSASGHAAQAVAMAKHVHLAARLEPSCFFSAGAHCHVFWLSRVAEVADVRCS